MAIDGLKLNGHGVLVPIEISGPIFERAQLASAIQQLAPRVPLSDGGNPVPVVTGDIEADWVNEGEAKHVATAGLDVVQLQPKKVATIIPFSEEVADNIPYIVELLQERGAEAIARAFDVAAILGKRTVGGAAGPFAKFLAQTTKAGTIGTAKPEAGGFFADLFTAAGLAFTGDYQPNGAILDVTAGGHFLPRFDATGRPVDVPMPFPYKFQKLTKYDGTVAGVTGDFSLCAWGAAKDLTIRLSNQATLKVGTDLLPLWQHNMVGLLLEARYGFGVGDLNAFAKLAPAAP